MSVLWALGLLAAAGDKPLEVIILPPQPKEVKPNVAMDVWSNVQSQLEKGQKEAGISLVLQKDVKDALSGPAKDQAWECDAEPVCLAELGATLGADLVVAGVVEKESVALLLVEVKSKKKVVGARSSKKLAKAGAKRQATAAIRGLLQGIDTWRKAPPEPEPPPPPPMAELRIPKDQLTDVTEVKIDGQPVAPAADGAISWKGSPGSHAVSAKRADGQGTELQVTLDPAAPVEVKLAFLAPAPPPPEPQIAPPPEDPSGDTVTSEWWFWTSLGAAVAVGGTTAVLLLGGIKGGPSINEDTGSISGTY
jgi:hypothetical protein